MASGGEFRNVIKTAFKFCRIPDKWKNYTACGNTISGERLILFKTPLSEKYHDNGEFGPEDSLQKDEEFTPKDLCENIQKKGHKLGLVVDFTNTKRYYEPMELTSRGIEYKKIKCEGKIVPPDKVVNRFKATILSFFKRFPTSSICDSLVGVHCTHGLNRAGYMVCRYLIECKGYAPDKAIEVFNKARGHEMERENYLEDLKERKPSLISEMDIEDLIKVTTFSDDEQNTRDDYNWQQKGRRHELDYYKPRRYEPYSSRKPRPQGQLRDERPAGRDYRQQDERGYQAQDDRNYRQRNAREYRQQDDRNYRQQDDRNYRERDDRDYRQQAQDDRGYQVQDDRDYRERDDREYRQRRDRDNSQEYDRNYRQRDNSDHRQPQFQNRHQTLFEYRRSYENYEWQPMGKRRYHNSGKQSEDFERTQSGSYYTEKLQWSQE